MNQHWPVADLDPVRKLRVMAAAIPGTDLTEWTIDAPPELVWQVASDLQAEMPRLVRDFRSVTITPGTGEHLVMHARGYLGQRARFDVVLRLAGAGCKAVSCCAAWPRHPTPPAPGSVSSAASGCLA